MIGIKLWVNCKLHPWSLGLTRFYTLMFQKLDFTPESLLSLAIQPPQLIFSVNWHIIMLTYFIFVKSTQNYVISIKNKWWLNPNRPSARPYPMNPDLYNPNPLSLDWTQIGHQLTSWAQATAGGEESWLHILVTASEVCKYSIIYVLIFSRLWFLGFSCWLLKLNSSYLGRWLDYNKPELVTIDST